MTVASQNSPSGFQEPVPKYEGIGSLHFLYSTGFRRRIAPTSFYLKNSYEVFMGHVSAMISDVTKDVPSSDNIYFTYLENTHCPISRTGICIPAPNPIDATDIHIDIDAESIEEKHHKYKLINTILFRAVNTKRLLVKSFKYNELWKHVEQICLTEKTTTNSIKASIPDSPKKFRLSNVLNVGQFGVSVYKEVTGKDHRFVFRFFSVPTNGVLLSDVMVNSFINNTQLVRVYYANIGLSQHASLLNKPINDDYEISTVHKLVCITLSNDKTITTKLSDEDKNKIRSFKQEFAKYVEDNDDDDDKKDDCDISSPFSLFFDEVNDAKRLKEEENTAGFDNSNNGINKLDLSNLKTMMGGKMPGKDEILKMISEVTGLPLDKLNNANIDEIVPGISVVRIGPDGRPVEMPNFMSPSELFDRLESELEEFKAPQSFKSFLNQKWRENGCLPDYHDKYGRKGCISAKRNKIFNGCKACIRYPDYFKFMKIDMINVLKESSWYKSDNKSAIATYNKVIDEIIDHLKTMLSSEHHGNRFYIRHGYIDSHDMLKNVMVNKELKYGHYLPLTQSRCTGYVIRRIIPEATLLFNLHGRPINMEMASMRIPEQTYKDPSTLKKFMRQNVLNRIMFGLITVQINKYAEDNGKLINDSVSSTIVIMPLAFTDYEKSFD